MKDCYSCDNCVYIGEGDHMCDVNNMLVLDDFMPTDNYFWCDGDEFE